MQGVSFHHNPGVGLLLSIGHRDSLVILILIKTKWRGYPPDGLAVFHYLRLRHHPVTTCSKFTEIVLHFHKSASWRDIFSSCIWTIIYICCLFAFSSSVLKIFSLSFTKTKISSALMFPPQSALRTITLLKWWCRRCQTITKIILQECMTN